ncbi:MAG: hypothetical protein WAN86_06255 [Hyphomicrobiaceae bacterium]
MVARTENAFARIGFRTVFSTRRSLWSSLCKRQRQHGAKLPLSCILMISIHDDCTGDALFLLLAAAFPAYDGPA